MGSLCRARKKLESRLVLWVSSSSWGPLLLVCVNDFVGVPLAWTLDDWASELQKLLAQ